MNFKALIGIVIVLLLAAGGWYFYQNMNTSSDAPRESIGEYAYQCANGSRFSMTPSENMSTLTLVADAQGMFTGTAILNQMGDGPYYENDTIVFRGAGEEVELSVGSETTTCNPVPNAEIAPWNWGDSAEGGGVRQDTSLIVSESIVGSWKSTEDAKFVRTFQDGGKVQDSYGGKVVATGTFKVFTTLNPISVNFPLQSDVVYVQLVMSGSQAETLNFKLNVLTPEILELTYMDRGGVLRFTAVQ